MKSWLRKQRSWKPNGRGWKASRPMNGKLLIPGEILTEGTNTFTFKTDDYVYAVNEVYPDSKDERHLYMFVESFILSSVPQDATASGT